MSAKPVGAFTGFVVNWQIDCGWSWPSARSVNLRLRCRSSAKRFPISLSNTTLTPLGIYLLPNVEFTVNFYACSRPGGLRTLPSGLGRHAVVSSKLLSSALHPRVATRPEQKIKGALPRYGSRKTKTKDKANFFANVELGDDLLQIRVERETVFIALAFPTRH